MVSLLEGITLAIAVWGAGLSSIHALLGVMRYRSEVVPHIMPSLHIETEEHSGHDQDTGRRRRKEVRILRLRVRNKGANSVTLEDAGIIYPDESKRSMDAGTPSGASFPYPLEPRGEHYEVWTRLESVAKEANNRGFSRAIEVTPYAVDGAGDQYEGAPLRIDVHAGVSEGTE